MMREKKCMKCGEVKSLEDFHKNKNNKDGHHYWCKNCLNAGVTKFKNTEKGYLKMRYDDMRGREFRKNRWGRKSKCLFTFDELLATFEKHKSIYGMRSAWGPGIDHLEQHLPITRIYRNGGAAYHRTGSNISVDRLDPNRDYTLQNIIFIRGDENSRKKDTSYEDCKIQVRLHEERFIKKTDIL